MRRYQATCQTCNWQGTSREAEDLTQYDEMEALAQGEADQHNTDNPGHKAVVVVFPS